jgi:hypothetical protein
MSKQERDVNIPGSKFEKEEKLFISTYQETTPASVTSISSTPTTKDIIYTRNTAHLDEPLSRSPSKNQVTAAKITHEQSQSDSPIKSPTKLEKTFETAAAFRIERFFHMIVERNKARKAVEVQKHLRVNKFAIHHSSPAIVLGDTISPVIPANGYRNKAVKMSKLDTIAEQHRSSASQDMILNLQLDEELDSLSLEGYELYKADLAEIVMERKQNVERRKLEMEREKVEEKANAEAAIRELEESIDMTMADVDSTSMRDMAVAERRRLAEIEAEEQKLADEVYGPQQHVLQYLQRSATVGLSGSDEARACVYPSVSCAL